MVSLDDLFARGPFSLSQTEKDAVLRDQLAALTAHHRARSPAYARLIDVLHAGHSAPARVADVPWLPVGLFKSHRLLSVPEDEVFKTLTSSGTTGQQPSVIVLDRITAELQARALAHVMGGVLGPKRLPMVVVDTKTLLKDRRSFSARGAGVLGMMNLGRGHFWALDEQMRLDLDGLRAFLDRHTGEPILLFGFTFMVWQFLLRAVEGQAVDLSNGVLVHSGGWKKLQEQAVDNATFKRRLREATGLSRVHNFYGMVEQVGSVFVEGDDGLLHPPSFSDVIVRDERTWAPCPPGVPGVLQVVSVLPRSYPGHSLLTEDRGVVHAVDANPDGWGGKAFEVLGRVPRAELRGCSDVFAAGAA